MAQVGCLGDTVFAVSRRKIKTFDGMKWSISAKYATHDRHLKDALLERTGIGVESLSFTMLLSVLLGTEPWTEIQALRNYTREGKLLSLIVGGKRYGEYKWVIKTMDVDMQRFGKKGNVLAAKVSLSLESYARR